MLRACVLAASVACTCAFHVPSCPVSQELLVAFRPQANACRTLAPGRRCGARELRSCADFGAADKQRQDDDAEAQSQLFRQAASAKEAADEAAARAARLRRDSSSRPLYQQSDQAAPQPQGGAESTQSCTQAEGEKAKFTRQFVQAEIEKPMGIALEENHVSYRGCKVAGVIAEGNAAAYQDLMGEAVPPLVGMQIVAVNGEDMLGKSLEEVMDAIGDAPSPVALELYHGLPSSLYAGWEQEALGKEVTINTGLPNKALIERLRSGL